MFRFTIRELVLLTTIVAQALGWFADHIYQSKPHPILIHPNFAEARLRKGEIMQIERREDGTVEFRVIWPWGLESPTQGEVKSREVHDLTPDAASASK